MTLAGARPTTAMVLAAGMGVRMQPLTDALPKPLIELAGRTLIDHVLDRLRDAGVRRAVVNVHYLADMLEAHLAARAAPEIVFADERGALLDTGGGVVGALSLLGEHPFFIHNSDSVWIERGAPALESMIAAWDDARMDSLMLLAPAAASLGYHGRGDFEMTRGGALARPRHGPAAPHVFAGVSIAHPRMFDGAPQGRYSLNALWDRAIADGRLYGVTLEGLWMHVGTPEALAEADAAIAAEQARGA
ncbi:MAG: nucleotidyltransferase family protein [Hyphomicrobium sp.]